MQRDIMKKVMGILLVACVVASDAKAMVLLNGDLKVGGEVSS